MASLTEPTNDWVEIEKSTNPTPEPRGLPEPQPPRDLGSALQQIFATVTEPFGPDHEDGEMRRLISDSTLEMSRQPWFSLSSSGRLFVLKRLLLLLKPTTLTNSTKATLVADIMILLGEVLLSPGELSEKYSIWCQDLIVLAEFLLELNPDLFSVGRLQRFLWSLRSAE